MCFISTNISQYVNNRHVNKQLIVRIGPYTKVLPPFLADMFIFGVLAK